MQIEERWRKIKGERLGEVEAFMEDGGDISFGAKGQRAPGTLLHKDAEFSFFKGVPLHKG